MAPSGRRCQAQSPRPHLRLADGSHPERNRLPERVVRVPLWRAAVNLLEAGASTMRTGANVSVQGHASVQTDGENERRAT